MFEDGNWLAVQDRKVNDVTMTTDKSVRKQRAGLVRAAGMIELTQRYGLNGALRRPAYINPHSITHVQPERVWSPNGDGAPYSVLFLGANDNFCEVEESALEVLKAISDYRGFDA